MQNRNRENLCFGIISAGGGGLVGITFYNLFKEVLNQQLILGEGLLALGILGLSYIAIKSACEIYFALAKNRIK